ncbi:flavin reductase family protein [Salinicoccus bachuensis]|uniref:Flavin reductase family protein n=1 Tax=Salinicoccus bachuensis TaxID=3136731 RepID=A0ABZ3CJI7_9STAP
MLDFTPQQLNEKEQKKFLIGSVIPRPIALVSTMSEEGIVNIGPFSYFNIVTYRPPMLSIAVQRVAGEPKDTARNISNTKEAVVHVVDQDNVEAANETAAQLGPEESELDVSAFTTVASKTVRPPGLDEAKVRMETELYDSMVIYDDDSHATTDLLLLKVVHFHIDDDIYHHGYVDPVKLGAVSRLAGHDYAEIGRMFTVQRPE